MEKKMKPNINLLNAIVFIDKAWKRVTDATIQNYFRIFNYYLQEEIMNKLNSQWNLNLNLMILWNITI